MANEKRSVDMVDHKKVPILSTIDGDIALDNLVIEDREVKEKALVRKVDIRMMPLMMLLCWYHRFFVIHRNLTVPPRYPQLS
jgi:hypothetical protein